MTKKLTEDQLSSIKYFWQDKGDLERYCSFEELKPALLEQKPEIIKAWNDYKTAVAILDAVIENI